MFPVYHTQQMFCSIESVPSHGKVHLKLVENYRFFDVVDGKFDGSLTHLKLNCGIPNVFLNFT